MKLQFKTLFRTLTGAALALAGAVLMAGCASFSGSTLVSGQSRAADVEATMGTPADRITESNGDSIWFYVRGPAARQTFAARIGADGVLKGIEPRLTEANLGKLQVDRSSAQEIRALLGPPNLILDFERTQRKHWEYKMASNGNPGVRPMALTLEIGTDGILRAIHYMDEFTDPSGTCQTC
jgi:hypothetical protein